MMERYQELIPKYFDYLKTYPVTIDVIPNKVRLISIGYNYSPDLPELLGRWRKENPSLSTSVFTITKENTTYWLDNLVLKRKDRILFLIQVDDKYVGHIGYSSFNWNEWSAEIDCVLRGEVTDVHKLMTKVLNKLLQWGKDTLLLQEIYLSTEEGNTRSLALYTRCGFEIIKRIPLFRHELPSGEIRWDYFEDRNPNDAERWGVYMQYTGRKDE